jgi:hypothetical protein
MTNVILFNNHAQTTFVRLAQKQDTFKPFKDLPSPLQRPTSKDLPPKTYQKTFTMFSNIVSVSNNATTNMNSYNGYEEVVNDDPIDEFTEYPAGSLKFSAYHYHSNRNPFYVLFIKNGSLIYIEIMNEYTRRHKIVEDIVMPFDVMLKNDDLKKLYDLSVMMVNTDDAIYYDRIGVATKRLIQTYDTDTDSEDYSSDEYEEDSNVNEEERAKARAEAKAKAKAEKPKPVVRHWCISCDTVWKYLRVSKSEQLNCYFNMNPFTYEYNMDSEENISGFMRSFDAFIKYNKVPPAIEAIIVANHEYSLRLVR